MFVLTTCVGGIGWLLSFSNDKLGFVFYKLELFLIGFFTLLLSQDAKFKKPADPAVVFKRLNKSDIKSKRFVFIRHGESDWNEVFNRGFGPSFFVRLIKAIIAEIKLLTCGDSIFVDSSLSPLGLRQARELNQVIASETKPNVTTGGDPGVYDMLRGEDLTNDSVIACSNLRRAIATAGIGLQGRLKKTGEKVHVLSSLQEISRNIDANAIAPSNSIPDLHVMEKEMYTSYKAVDMFDVALNTGNKPMFGNGLSRMQTFNKWAFQRGEGTIIVGGGHSLWFRTFFRLFLPYSSRHISKDKKMVNCGVVSFVIQQASVNGEAHYRIDPESISVTHGGFAK